jgi:hypothetical protein
MTPVIDFFALSEFEVPPFLSPLADRIDLRSTFPMSGQPFKILRLIFLPSDRHILPRSARGPRRTK